MIRNSLFKILSIMLIIGLNWFGFSAIGQTFAYMNDTETSSENFWNAGTLAFSLSSTSNFIPQVTPTQSANRNVSVVNNGSLDFQYNARTVIDAESSDIGFCNALKLEAKLGSEVKYPYTGSGNSLAGLSFGNPIVIDDDGQDDWTFTITLLSGYIPPEEGAGCSFTFVFDAWQENLAFGQGFFDNEELDNTIETGGGISTTSGYSPIADAYVDQSHADKNFENSKTLSIKSKNPDNNRAFIKFDFDFPSGTTILSAHLKLYMKSAPPSSRIYEAKRVLASWKERDPDGIDWNNQPSVFATSTSVVSSGDSTPKWLSWDVTSDVQSFVTGTYTNYGWRLSDSVESATTTYEAKFHSRESNSIELRPILEITFTPPEVTTAYPVINEVYYDVASGKGNDPKNEWVEIYNPTDLPVDISGWKICEKDGCDTIPSTTPIPAKGFAIASGKSSTWEDYWTLPAGTITIDLPGEKIGNNGLKDNGDRVILKNASDLVIDAMSYGLDTSQLNPSVPLSGKGKSLARIIKGYDTDLATDWIINATPNPGTNPSIDGVETLIFTSYGVAVAGYEPVIEEDDSGEEEIFEEETTEEETATPLSSVEGGATGQAEEQPAIIKSPLLLGNRELTPKPGTEPGDDDDNDDDK